MGRGCRDWPVGSVAGADGATVAAPPKGDPAWRSICFSSTTAVRPRPSTMSQYRCRSNRLAGHRFCWRGRAAHRHGRRAGRCRRYASRCRSSCGRAGVVRSQSFWQARPLEMAKRLGISCLGESQSCWQLSRIRPFLTQSARCSLNALSRSVSSRGEIRPTRRRRRCVATDLTCSACAFESTLRPLAGAVSST